MQFDQEPLYLSCLYDNCTPHSLETQPSHTFAQCTSGLGSGPPKHKLEQTFTENGWIIRPINELNQHNLI